ncbi:MAG TPA: signal peptidase II [Pirellulales bacterium]|jgi:signal peptidase II|nr:signal peptidase II [Pirellulales bacterium]
MRLSVPKNRVAVFLLIAIAGCAIDLGTKSWIFSRLGMPDPNGPSIEIVPHHFTFTTSLNNGALFGIGQGQGWLFATLSVVAAIGICYWLFIVGAAREWLLTIALACVTAGIFGNLYDRLGLPGLKWNAGPRIGQPVYAVRDWLYFRTINFPIFNIADSLLVCGAGLMLLHAFWSGRRKAEPAGNLA